MKWAVLVLVVLLAGCAKQVVHDTKTVTVTTPAKTKIVQTKPRTITRYIMPPHASLSSLGVVDHFGRMLRMQPTGESEEVSLGQITSACGAIGMSFVTEFPVNTTGDIKYTDVLCAPKGRR